jgi:dienelactone hydrolase
MSKRRNFSPTEYWNRLAENHTPELAFKGSTRADYETWESAARPKYRELLGRFPERVPLNAEVMSTVEDNGLIRQRVVFDVDPYMSIPCQVLYPQDMKPDGSNPAIICCHGHGPGKDAVAGIRSEPEIEQFIDYHNFDYGRQMAQAGFLTICPELRGFGERLDSPTPYPHRDPCNIDYIKGTLIGYYPLTLNLWDIMCCIDYLETRPEVDKNRIGMMGLSGGGTMTTFVAAYDHRIKAADIMGYVNPFQEFCYKRANFCGMQILPDLYRWFDTDEIAGLIAPRPLLVEMGIYDECFYIHDLLKGYEGIREIYTAAGADSVLDCDIFPGPHAFGGNKAVEFFRKYL